MATSLLLLLSTSLSVRGLTTVPTDLPVHMPTKPYELHAYNPVATADQMVIAGHARCVRGAVFPIRWGLL